MMPTIPTNCSSPTKDIGSATTAASSPVRSRTANARTRSPFSDICRFAARILSRTSGIGTVPLSVSMVVHRSSTTSGPPLTSSINRVPPVGAGTLWKVAMNLYAESKGTSAARG